MRLKRMLAPWADSEDRRAIYHVMSRVVDRQFVLGDEEKEEFVRLMRGYEKFCGVKVLTYCVMSNHFHLLVEVPPISIYRAGDGRSDPDETFFERLEAIYSNEFVEGIAEEMRGIRKNVAFESAGAREAGVAAVKARFEGRFNDLGAFMKALKGRFTQWFNKKHGRRGTLWEERYKSVIVESGHACRVMAGYIDLNPVRAGIVESAEDYRWCGYAEAVVGKRVATRGIQRIVSEREEALHGQSNLERISQKQAMVLYRRLMKGDDAEKDFAGAFTDKAVREIAEDALNWSKVLRCKIRYFNDGVAIGSKAFADGVFEGAREYFSKRRTSGARRMRGLPGGLSNMRDLRVDVF